MLRRQRPFGSDDGARPDVRVQRDRAVHFAELVEDADRIVLSRGRAPRRRPGASAASPARSRSSPSVDEMVFSLAGEISASGYCSVAGIRLVAVEAGRRAARRARRERDRSSRRASAGRRRRTGSARRRTAASPTPCLASARRDVRRAAGRRSRSSVSVSSSGVADAEPARRARRRPPRSAAPRPTGSITGRTSCRLIGP